MAAGRFTLPYFPKPEYYALQHLSALLTSRTGIATTQLEVLCAGLRLMAELVNAGDLATLERHLADFRETAPSETPPLIKAPPPGPATG